MSLVADVWLLAARYGSSDNTVLWIIIAVLVVCLLIGAARASAADASVLRHWSHLIDGLSYSSKEFYASLKEALLVRGIPGAKSMEIRVAEGGPLISAKRLYLRVKRGEEYIDICAAPFGRGFFFSSWLILPPSVLRLSPIIGWVIAMFSPPTYYKLDTAGMFHAMVHGAVMECVDGVTSAKGIRALTESERKPIMKGFGA